MSFILQAKATVLNFRRALQVKFFQWLGLFLSLWFLTACQTHAPQAVTESRPKILCTTAMIADLVAYVAGEQAEIATLISGELDPHSYQLVKGDDDKFLQAQLIFYNGLGLEHGPSLYQQLAHNSKALSLGNAIKRHNESAILYVDGQPDPHIWMDIALWAQGVESIVQALSQIAPEHAALFQQRGAALYAELQRADRQLYAIVQAIPPAQRYLITSHDAFNYFTRAYLATPSERENGTWRCRFAAPEGLAPDSQLSVADIQKIVDYIAQYQVKALFPESNVSRDSLKKIAQAVQAKGFSIFIVTEPLYGDAMGPPGSDGDTYVKMMQHDGRVIARYLGE